jgi:hypothetical protein
MPDHPLFPVSVVTPEGPAYEGEAEMLIVPGDAGEIGVLARHAPLVAMLKAGSTRVHLGDGEVREFATGPGFFQDDVDIARFQRRSSRRNRVGLEDLVSLELEIDPAEQPNRRLVVNDENPRRGRMPLGVVHRSDDIREARSVTGLGGHSFNP